MVSSIDRSSLYSGQTRVQKTRRTFSYDAGLIYDGMNGGPLSSQCKSDEFSGGNATSLQSLTDWFWLGKMQYERFGMASVQVFSDISAPEFSGQLRSRTIVDNVKNVMNRSVPSYTTMSSDQYPTWSSSVRLVKERSRMDTVFQLGTNGAKAYQVTESYTTEWNPITFQPEVTVQIAGKDDGTYKHFVQVQNFNAAGYPMGVRSAKFKNRADAIQYITNPKSATVTYGTQLQNAVVTGLAAPVSATETGYDANLRDVVAVAGWGLQTQNGDAAVGTTVAMPANYDVAGAWTLVAQYGPRSTTGDLIQSVSLANLNFPNYQVRIHEGARGLASAVASGSASRKEIAALTAEDGSITGTENFTGVNEFQGRWEIGNYTGTVTRAFDNTRAHTGKWSIKVQNDYGPTVNVPLDGVLARKEGLVVSAWGYNTSATMPGLAIQVRDASGATKISPAASPVGGYKPNTWQLWKAVVPYKDLNAAALGAGGYARVFFMNLGTDAPLWVDDFVVAPTGVNVALQTYDEFGRPVTQSDLDGHVVTTEYGARGEVKAVRDERGRIFGQSAIIPAGEN